MSQLVKKTGNLAGFDLDVNFCKIEKDFCKIAVRHILFQKISFSIF